MQIYSLSEELCLGLRARFVAVIIFVGANFLGRNLSDLRANIVRRTDVAISVLNPKMKDPMHMVIGCSRDIQTIALSSKCLSAV